MSIIIIAVHKCTPKGTVPSEVTYTKYELYRSKIKVVGSIQAMSSEKPGVQNAYDGLVR